MKLVCLLSPVWQQSTEVDLDWLPWKATTWKPFTCTVHGPTQIFHCKCTHIFALVYKLASFRPNCLQTLSPQNREADICVAVVILPGRPIVLSLSLSPKKSLARSPSSLHGVLLFCRYCHVHHPDSVVSLGSETQARKKILNIKNLLKSSLWKTGNTALGEARI